MDYKSLKIFNFEIRRMKRLPVIHYRYRDPLTVSYVSSKDILIVNSCLDAYWVLRRMSSSIVNFLQDRDNRIKVTFVWVTSDECCIIAIQIILIKRFERIKSFFEYALY